jgi:hypothetical protein
MVWYIIGGIVYFILMVTLGVMSLRNGHWVMFIIGIFLPFFWLIGALMPSRRLPTRRASGVTTPVTGGSARQRAVAGARSTGKD